MSRTPSAARLALQEETQCALREMQARALQESAAKLPHAHRCALERLRKAGGRISSPDDGYSYHILCRLECEGLVTFTPHEGRPSAAQDRPHPYQALGGAWSLVGQLEQEEVQP